MQRALQRMLQRVNLTSRLLFTIPESGWGSLGGDHRGCNSRCKLVSRAERGWIASQSRLFFHLSVLPLNCLDTLGRIFGRIFLSIESGPRASILRKNTEPRSMVCHVDILLPNKYSFSHGSISKFNEVVTCRAARGFSFSAGVDDAESECGLDDVAHWARRFRFLCLRLVDESHGRL